jgi:cobalt-zinc-cadmium resistance protein CzcA
MLNKIITYSIKNKLIVGLFVVSLIGWGAYQVTQLPIDAVPDITDNQVQVITVSPALGATDIERLVTFPIEQACSSIPGTKQIRSFSRFGLSLITIVFEDKIDIYWARQQISEKLQKVQQDIPPGTGTPELAPVSTGLGEIFQYVVRPLKGYESKFDAMELRTIQDWIVRRQLIGTPGVAEVASFGGKLKQYEISVRQDQLKSYGLTISDIFSALEKNNQNTGGAYIEKGPTVLYIRSEGLTVNIADIEKIVVKQMSNGNPLLIRDIAKVQLGSAIRYGAMTYNDEGEVAGAVVMMLKGENSSLVVKRVKDKIAEIQKMLPEGVVIEPFLDRTKMVNNAISTVKTNLMEGALIVIFVLVFFLGNLRAGLIVSSVIPLSMLFAIILMNMFGVGGNLMSLGAIDFGLIVDGSVIVIEAILHRFAHSKHFRTLVRVNQVEMDEEVGKSTGSMIKSAVFSQIIILIVYIPILSLEGIEGKMFKPMAFTIAFAIFGAFILSITYVPMMAALFLNKKLNHKKNITDRLMIWLERSYQPFLKMVLKIPKTVIGITVLLFFVSVGLLMNMGGEFIPQLEEGDFAVETRVLTGSNLNNTIESTQKATKLLLQNFPEVEKIVTKIGSAEIPTDPMPFEAGDMMIILKDKNEWTSAKTFSELSMKMTKVLEQVPGITVGFQFPVQMRFNELMTGARQDVVCKIFGENLDTLTHYAARLNGIIQTVDGAVNIYEEKVTGMPQVVIKYNRDGMAKYGLNVEDVNRVVNSAFAGQIAGQVYEEEKRFDMVVRLEGESRKSLADIQNLNITTANGMQIPLSYIAGIEEIEGVNQIQRENTKRRIIVGFNINGRDVQTIVKELQTKIGQQLNLQKGYTIVYGGSFENMTAAKDRLSIVVPIALFLIFLLLYFAFGSVKQGLLIYTAIPLSAMGGIFALWARSMPFSISAGVGFIALFGVAVLNGILLVTEFNRLKSEGWHDISRIVIHATKSKLRAVLMTALVPALGFIPMAISTGAGGEVQKPLATVVIGGLIISTLLTLFVLPVMYLLFEKGTKYLTMNKNTAITILMLLLFGQASFAQNKISLSAAIDTALKNNTSLRASNLNVDYYNALRKSNVDIDKTLFDFGYGKINSFQNDNRVLVSQNIQFPSVYKSQGDINRSNRAISELSKLTNEIELKSLVKNKYYQLLVLQNKKQLLIQADSIYSAFVTKANQRYNAGGADILEKVTAESQLTQISNQLQILSLSFESNLNEFNYLINGTNSYTPASDKLEISLTQLPDVYAIQQTPVVQMGEQKVVLAENQQKLEKGKLQPSFNVGYSSSTIIGWQPTTQGSESYFGSNHRFGAINLGLSLPIFSTAQKSKIAASKVQIEQNKLESLALQQQLSSNFKNLLSAYLQNKKLVIAYQKNMLPNATLLIETAGRKINAGEITYLEWVMIINQAIQIKSEYLNYIQQLNENAIELEKLTATK